MSTIATNVETEHEYKCYIQISKEYDFIPIAEKMEVYENKVNNKNIYNHLFFSMKFPFCYTCYL